MKSMDTNQPEKQLVLISRDLFFFSNIQFIAKSLRAEASLVNGLSQMNDHPGATCILVDLELPGLDFNALENIHDQSKVTIIGYAPHVKTDLFDAARKVGVTRLYSRGQLNRSTSEILSEGLR
ncbi:hypothetical protein OAF24_03945 [bacterium]|nr:hypothetical protein [bacterium]